MNPCRLFATIALLSAASTAHAQTFSFGNPGVIADGPSNVPGVYGAPRVMTTTSNVANPIQDVVLTITINHTYISDLRIRLAYTPTGSPTTSTALVLNRIGAFSTGQASNLNGTYVFVLGPTPIHTAVAPLESTETVPSGAYAPSSSNLNGTHTVTEFADFFRGLSGTGAWTLTLEDGQAQDIGIVSVASIALQARPLPCLADFNSDGVVNSADLVYFLGRFGGACQ